MDATRHADLAHQLITACDGVDAIVREKLCRVSSSQLYAYQDPGKVQFMPADVIADLEAWHGEPIYSRALFEARPSSAKVVELLTAACEETEEAAELQRFARQVAAHPRGPTLRERQKIERLNDRLEEGVREVRQALAERGRS